MNEFEPFQEGAYVNSGIKTYNERLFQRLQDQTEEGDRFFDPEILLKGCFTLYKLHATRPEDQQQQQLENAKSFVYLYSLLPSVHIQDPVFSVWIRAMRRKYPKLLTLV